MPPRRLRYSRSKNGCQQCRRVSSKCDETMPVCSRCKRLNKPCDYSKALVWHAKHAFVVTDFPIDRLKRRVSPIDPQTTAKDLLSPGLPCSLDDSQRNHFVCRSQKLLHWTKTSNNSVLSKLGPLSNQTPAIRDGIIALEQLHQGSLVSSLASIDRAITSLKIELSKQPDLKRMEIVEACTLLIVQLSMRAGYYWTHQLPALLGLAMTNTVNHVMIEAIAGLDMNAWILGRQSEAQHIWWKHCMGRPGSESITGLPRPFLDLVARASLQQDIGADLDIYILRARLDGINEPSILLLFALALLLYTHGYGQSQVSHDTTIESLAKFTFSMWNQHKDDYLFNERALIWPAYMICCSCQPSAPYYQAKNLLLTILGSTSRPSLADPLLRVMRVYWNRKEAGVTVTPDAIARELSVEVGVW